MRSWATGVGKTVGCHVKDVDARAHARGGRGVRWPTHELTPARSSKRATRSTMSEGITGTRREEGDRGVECAVRRNADGGKRRRKGGEKGDCGLASAAGGALKREVRG